MVPDKVTVPRKASPEAQQPRTEEPDQIRWEPRVPHPDHDAEDLKEEAAAEALRSRGKTLADSINMLVGNVCSLLFELWSRCSSEHPNVKRRLLAQSQRLVVEGLS